MSVEHSMARGKRGRGGGRGVIKPVSQQPVRRIMTPIRGRLNSSDIGLNFVQRRRVQFEAPAAPADEAGPPGQVQQGPVVQPVHGPTQQGQLADPLDAPEPMDVNVNRVNALADGRQIDGDQIDLSSRLDPIVPGPLAQVRQDDDGWGEIDKLGAPFPAIEEIPAQHREAWALAMEKVHRKIWEAQEEGEDLDRALKWWFFLPQALCRKAQRGGRAGVGQIKKRFNCIVRGDFGELVHLWIHDKELAKKEGIEKK